MFATAQKANAKPKNASLFQRDQGMDAFIQPKLNIGKSGDQYEVEADRVADTVVARGHENTSNSPFFAPSSNVQRKPEEELQTKQEKGNSIQEKPLIPNITPIVQKQVEEDTVQEKEDDEVQLKEDEQIQKQAVAGDDPGDTSSLENNLNISKGGGSPLPSATKSEMESGFGTDFSGVRVHNDSNAVQMNQQLGAQAFTHGSDVYFNEGKYNPQSNTGKHLLAHELTHTVQQGKSIQAKMIQRTGDDESSFDVNNFSISFKGLIINVNITPNGDDIIIDKIPMGAYKVAIHNRVRPLIRPKNYRRNSSEENNNQREIWIEALASAASISNFVSEQIQTEYREVPRNNKVYIFKVPGGKGNSYRRIIGTPQAIHKEFTMPSWRSNGSRRWFHVDHMQELQLGGQNDVNNLNLLNEQSNRSYGFSIYRNIRSIAKRIADHEKSNSNPNSKRSSLNNADSVLENWNMRFQNAIKDPQSSAGENPSHWDYSQIYAGDHLAATNDIELETIQSLGDASRVFVFPFENGGLGKQFNNNSSVIQNERRWLNPWLITAKSFNTQEGSETDSTLGTFNFELKENEVAEAIDQTPIDINRYRGARYAGYLDVNRFFLSQYNWQGFGIKKFSPITFQGAIMDSERGLVIRGKVNPTLGLIADTTLDLEISSGDIKVSKIFNTGSLNFPTPFEIKASNLELFLSIENGLGIEGRVDFGINNVGEGYIGASASTSGGFELEGAFNFDSELLDPAEINVEYKDNIWTIGGEIGIPEGKVRGVKNATITAEYSEGNFAATGEAELDIPGIQRGTMSVNYGDEGFSISGNFDLSDDIPGIQGGNVEARVSKAEGAENSDVFVSGTAIPDIPGISTLLTVTYENGALTILGSAAYSRGMLSGSIVVGATNRTIGEDGQPTGDPDDTMRVYGGGTLTLQLTPWLAATAGVKFLPNGEIEVTASLATDTYDVFARKEFNRNLFTVPTIEIPLFAIPLGPRSLGLVAQISGGLDFTAGFGPGQLRNLSAEITYNPEKEDETTVTGHGEFGIPADAGLTMRGDLGLGLSVGIASLSGGIELAGTLGLEGEALASVDVNWGPQTGITLDAEGRVTVNPKFTFDVNAFARASLGIGFLSISETWRHNLASFSWGPDIQFGLVFPVHYQEDQPFDISFDDIEVIYPQLDVVDMAVDLARDIKDDMFD